VSEGENCKIKENVLSPTLRKLITPVWMAVEVNRLVRWISALDLVRWILVASHDTAAALLQLQQELSFMQLEL
jgi:hypothetical protein